MATGDINHEAGISYPMNNAELADAISAAYNRSGDAGLIQKIHTEHMKALLEIQRCRAAHALLLEAE